MTFIEFEPILNFARGKNIIEPDNYVKNFNQNYSDTDYSFSPKIDISEDEKNIYLEAEIPGLKKDEIKIKLVNNTLTISGEKKNSINPNNKVIYSERVFGSFTRTFEINSEINRSSINASFENGILKISLGKLIPEKNEREIEIN